MENREYLASAAVAAPTRPVAPSAGYPQGGLTPTKPGSYWFHAMGEEQRAILGAGGVAPDGAVLNQVQQAIRRMAGSNITTVNAAMSPFQLTVDHAGIVLISADTGPVTLVLPASNAVTNLPLKFSFFMTAATANAGTVNKSALGGNVDTIDGLGSFVLTGQFSSRSICGDGVSAWVTMANGNLAVRTARFSATSNWTVPAGVTQILVTGVGGGGGGGGSGGNPYASIPLASGGGGGGGAGVSQTNIQIAVTPGEVLFVGVAAGGAGGTAGAAAASPGGNGQAGGATFINRGAGGIFACFGGVAGFGSLSPLGTANFSAGGGGGGGGGSGNFGFYASATGATGTLAGAGGVGGSSPLGSGGSGGAAVGAPSVGNAGVGGSGNGGGGGGSGGSAQIANTGPTAGAVGGVGAAGLLIIQF